jgi:site-specific DNA recombinase
MNVAIYARVSTEGQSDRGTIGSQLEALRQQVSAESVAVAGEYIDDGYSGARLDRPGLDALRDAAAAGLIDQVWCLTPDRLSRSYAYQVLISDELARYGVSIRYLDAPEVNSDPQARLLTQIQSVIAEYERAKISERSRRGKLFRARAGEAVHRQVPYGYIRVPRSPGRPAHLVINETQAVTVRRIFADYTTGGLSLKKIADNLNTENIPSPGGSHWLTSTLSRLMQRPVYIGRSQVNTTQMVNDRGPGAKPRQIRRPEQEWITVPCPPIIDEPTFAAAGRACAQNTNFAARRLNPDEEAFLLRGLVYCSCGTLTMVHRGRSKRATTEQLYYRCRDKGGTSSRPPLGCGDRSVRAQPLDDFVFAEITAALRTPELLLTAQQSIAKRKPAPDDQLLAAEIDRLRRRLDNTHAERRRIADMYQTGIIDAAELSRRATDIDRRNKELTDTRDNLTAQHRQLSTDNQLRHRVNDFATKAATGIDQLDFHQRQRLVRLLIERVQVTGWQVNIHLRIPLEHPAPTTNQPGPGPPPLSSEERLRSIGHRGRIAVTESVRAGLLPDQANQSSVIDPNQHRSTGGVNGFDHPTLRGNQPIVMVRGQRHDLIPGPVGGAARADHFGAGEPTGPLHPGPGGGVEFGHVRPPPRIQTHILPGGNIGSPGVHRGL